MVLRLHLRCTMYAKCTYIFCKLLFLNIYFSKCGPNCGLCAVWSLPLESKSGLFRHSRKKKNEFLSFNKVTDRILFNLLDTGS
jgi:hypothetical protein